MTFSLPNDDAKLGNDDAKLGNDDAKLGNDDAKCTYYTGARYTGARTIIFKTLEF